MTQQLHWWVAIFIGLIAVAESPAGEPPRVDLHGDPLPDGALMRLGTVGFRIAGVAGVGFRPTGELVALTESMNLHIWPADAKSKPSVTSVTGEKKSYGRVALSPDARFAAAHTERGVVVWDVSSNSPVEYLSHSVGYVYKLCFSADGAWLAVNDTTRGKETILLCNLAAKTWDQFPLGGQYAESLAFTPDGKSLVVLVRQTITVIDTAARKERFKVQGPRVNLAFAALSPDGTKVALQPTTFIHGTEPKVRFLSVPDGKEITELKLPPSSSARWVDFSSDGKTILLGGARGIREYDPVAGKLIREIAGPAEKPVVYSPTAAGWRRTATTRSCSPT